MDGPEPNSVPRNTMAPSHVMVVGILALVAMLTLCVVVVALVVVARGPTTTIQGDGNATRITHSPSITTQVAPDASVTSRS
jgi:hypothetical protein